MTETAQATQSAAQSTGQANGAQSSATAQAGKTFSQAELDQVIQERLGRERQKYADYEDLKKAATKLAEMEKSQLTEKERLERELKEAREQATKLASEVQASRAMAAASKAGALYPDLVAAKIPAEAMGDDKKLDAALSEVKKQYPALFGRAAGSADGGAGAGGKSAGGGMNAWIRASAGR